MELMEIRRGLIGAMSSPNVRKILQSMNVVYGYELSDGYVNVGGTITPPNSTQKEKVTANFIKNPFVLTESYLCIQEFRGDLINALAGAGWCGVGLYDGDGSFRTRTTFSPNRTFKIADCVYTVYTPMTFAYDDGLCKISFRTYGESSIIIVPYSALVSDLFDVFGASASTSN